ncbi:hypothetical protein TRICI_002758 [Trichomonascus ciferrii]|uniref:Kinetochore protein Sos7 coiled-coil domain-containing protein n=1 Tax=Trichomonascus ciferrii TaxID=44093 RepID=A0A642V5V0_9ASCO|nr:hypothetical protein TRICI_002758 [Trichomonascus ciferrii]
MEEIKRFEETHFNLFDLKAEYARRQRVIYENGKKGKHRLDTGEVTVNPNPTVLPQEIQKHIEQFENMKVTYLEQETKEKFLRSIISDPPVFVEQSNVEEIEAENKQKKANLKKQKAQVNEVQRQLDLLSRQLCADYEDLSTKAKGASEMSKEMETMQAEIDKLTKQEEALELPALEDPDMNLPAPELNRLADEYGKQKQEIDQTLVELTSQSIPQSREEHNQLKQEVSRLEKEKTRTENMAQEMVKLREEEMQKGRIHNETTAEWYRSLIHILEHILGISNFELTQQDHPQTKISFTYKDAHQVELLANSQTGELLSASLSNSNAENVQTILKQTKSLPPATQVQSFIRQALLS